MDKLSLILSTFLVCACSMTDMPVEKEDMTIHSGSLGKDMKFSVILPAGYASSDDNYPVLYMLHGIGGDSSTWPEYCNIARVSASMVDNGEIGPCIYVSPDGENSYYCNAYDGSYPYETFLTEELIPYMDNNFRTIAGPEGRSVMGFSMGGFGALSTGLRHRDIFGSAIALSASIRTDSQYETESPQEEWDSQWGKIFGGVGETGKARLTDYYLKHSPYHIIEGAGDLGDFGIMLDIGDKEGTLCSSNEELHEMLLRKGVKHEWEVRAGGHDFNCWNAALPKALKFADAHFKSKAKAVKTEYADSPEAEESDGRYIVMPAGNSISVRKYPVVYVTGVVDKKIRNLLAEEYSDLTKDLSVRPAVLCFLRPDDDLGEAISEMESSHSEFHSSQRMRALVSFGKTVCGFGESLEEDNLFSCVICVNPEIDAATSEKIMTSIGKYRRYPKLWIENPPESSCYKDVSDIHVAMRQAGLDHQFRSRSIDDDNIEKCIEEWIEFLDEQIFI